MVTPQPTRTCRHLMLSAVVVALALATTGCNDDDGAASTDPLPPTTPTSTGTTPTSVTTVPDTTGVSSTTELNPVPTTPVVTTGSAVVTTGPPVTVELPPVTTLVPEVPADLLRPEQTDPASPNNNRPVLPEHVPVIEAHLRGLQQSNLVFSTWPIDPEAPELLSEPVTPELLALEQQGARERLARGEVLNVSQGITFRPYVVGPVTDTATVLDCELAGHYWVKADTGELLPPNEIWPAGPGRIVEVGLRNNLVLRDGQWLTAESFIDPGACA